MVLGFVLLKPITITIPSWKLRAVKKSNEMWRCSYRAVVVEAHYYCSASCRKLSNHVHDWIRREGVATVSTLSRTKRSCFPATVCAPVCTLRIDNGNSGIPQQPDDLIVGRTLCAPAKFKFETLKSKWPRAATLVKVPPLLKAAR